MRPALLLLCFYWLSCAPPSRLAAPRGAPPLFDPGEIGRVSFPVTTSSPLAQRYFEQGVALLRDFWYYEALRSFQYAARLDSTCAMAWWGIYQTPRGGRALKRRALARARRFARRASDREQRYIGASAALDSLGRAAYIEQMQALIARYPDDVEAKIFLVRFLQRGYHPDRPRAGEPDPVELIEPLLRSHPEHVGVHHYYIHLIEPGARPGRALASARSIAALAPASGHIVHMPGHIYYLTGAYAEARDAFLAALAADSTYMARYGIMAENNWNYAHNLAYLVANCAEDGRYAEGIAWARRLERISLSRRRTLIFYQGRLARARLHMRYGQWRRAAESLRAVAANDTLARSFARSYARAMEHYALGMEAVERGEAEAAAAHLQAIEDMSWAYAFGGGRRNDPYYARRRLTYINVLAFELEAHLRALEGDAAAARDRLEAAQRAAAKLPYEEPPEIVRPLAESLGQALLRLGDWQGARDAFLAALQKRPQSGHVLWGLARAHALGGQEEQMRQTYAELLRAWPHADPELPALRAARAASGD